MTDDTTTKPVDPTPNGQHDKTPVPVPVPNGQHDKAEALIGSLDGQHDGVPVPDGTDGQHDSEPVGSPGN